MFVILFILMPNEAGVHFADRSNTVREILLRKMLIVFRFCVRGLVVVDCFICMSHNTRRSFQLDTQYTCYYSTLGI